MSDQSLSAEALASVSPDPTTIPTPTPTHYQQIAAQIIASLTEMTKQIPALEGKHVATAQFVRTHQNVPLDFIETVISAVELTPALQGTQKFDANEARDGLQFLQAFRPVHDLLTTFAKDLKFTLGARRAKLSLDSLQMYNIAKGVARDPSTPEVGAHVENMSRDLGRKKRARVAKAPTPADGANAPPAAEKPKAA